MRVVNSDRLVIVHHSLDAVAQMPDVEVDQQSNSASAESWVRQQLRFTDSRSFWTELGFDNDDVLNQQIHPVCGRDRQPTIGDRYGHFGLVVTKSTKF